MNASSSHRRQRAAIAVLAVLILGFMAGRSLCKVLVSHHAPSNQVMVSVTGEVKNPGNYLLEGPLVTVGEAVEAAGGLRGESSATIAMEMALRPVCSGQVIRLSASAHGPLEVAIEPMPAAARLTLGQKLNVNTSSEEDLMLVPKMKSEFAMAVVDHRRRSCWQRLEELERIPGVGPKTVEKWHRYLEATGCSMGDKE